MTERERGEIRRSAPRLRGPRAMMKARAHLVLVVSGVVASLGMVLVACGHEENAKSPGNAEMPAMADASSSLSPDAGPSAMESVPPASPSVANIESAAPTASPDAGGSSSASSAEPTPTLSDADILDVLHVANRGEIEQGNLAQGKAHDARVKKLAAMMVKDHMAADAKGTALSKKNKLTPTQNSLASSIQSEADSTTSSLKSETGTSFDHDYVDAQVKEHQAVLDTIDQKLLPVVKNADLKAFINDVRPKIAMHLQHAEDLQKSLQK